MNIIKGILITLVIMFLMPISVKAESVDTLELERYQVTTYIQSRSIEPRSSLVLHKTTWGFTKNECTLLYTFVASTSGSVTITLEKENSNGTWTDVASKYHTFSFTASTSTSVPVSNLSSGTYRVKTDIYAVVAGTLYTETKYTGTRNLY